jgi:hypothetical protein
VLSWKWRVDVLIFENSFTQTQKTMRFLRLVANSFPEIYSLGEGYFCYAIGKAFISLKRKAKINARASAIFF